MLANILTYLIFNHKIGIKNPISIRIYYSDPQMDVDSCSESEAIVGVFKDSILFNGEQGRSKYSLP